MDISSFCDNDKVPKLIVKQNRLGNGVYAGESIRGGSLLTWILGQRMPHRTRMTVQVDWTTHIDIGMPWQYINHSCEANCYLRTRHGDAAVAIVAQRDLVSGEELFLDYELFEYEIGYFPSVCCCGSPSCRKVIRGYRFLSEETRKACAPFVVGYLKTSRPPVG